MQAEIDKCKENIEMAKEILLLLEEINLLCVKLRFHPHSAQELRHDVQKQLRHYRADLAEAEGN